MKPSPIRNVNIVAAQQEALCMPLIWIMTRQMECFPKITPGEGILLPVTCKVGQSDVFSLPVEPAGKSARLLNGVRGDTYRLVTAVFS